MADAIRSTVKSRGEEGHNGQVVCATGTSCSRQGAVFSLDSH